MGANIGSALVALYDHPTDDGERHFLASGVFIAPAVVLTAGHVFNGRSYRQVWVRPSGGRALPIAAEPARHESLDAAWLRLETMPQAASFLTLDLSTQPRMGQAYTLNGYFEGRQNVGLSRSVTAFDESTRWYPIEPIHGQGLSGAALCHADRLWAITVARYVDIAANRGCAVAVHQLVGGFLADIPELCAVLGDVAGIEPSPNLTDYRHDPLVPPARNALESLFALAPLSDWPHARPARDRLPALIADAFDGAAERVGSQVLTLLADRYLKFFYVDIDEGALQVDAAAARKIHRRVREAVGLAARLCLDHRQRLRFESSIQSLIPLPAKRDQSAALVMRKDPLDALEFMPEKKNRQTRDQYAARVGLEMGVGDDRFYGILSIVASMRSDLNTTAEAMAPRTDIELDEWQAFLRDERRDGRGRHILLGKQEYDALDKPLVQRLDEFGITVIQLTGEDTGLFLFKEPDLVGIVNRVVYDLKTKPVWKEVHGAA